MNLTYLPIFYAVARHGGFSKASKELRIQQPSISRAVKLLEENLKQKLFVRHRHHLELTPVGKTLLQLCERVFSDISATLGKLELEVTGPRGPLDFGVADHILSGPLAPPLTAFLKEYPQVYPRAFTGTSQDICQRVLTEELEFAFLVTVPPEPGLKIKAIATFPAHVYIASKSARDPKTQSFFVGSREVDYTGNRDFPTLEALKKQNPETEVRFSSNNLEIHKRFVLDGIGIAILPDFMMRAELKSKKVKIFQDKYEFQTKLWLVTKSGHQLNSQSSLFIKSLGDRLFL